MAVTITKGFETELKSVGGKYLLLTELEVVVATDPAALSDMTLEALGLDSRHKLCSVTGSKDTLGYLVGINADRTGLLPASGTTFATGTYRFTIITRY